MLNVGYISYTAYPCVIAVHAPCMTQKAAPAAINWLPGISGPGLCERLRDFDKTTPILFYSGAAYERDKEQARLAGAQGYLVKPTDGDTLAAEVSRLIAESKVADL